MKEHDIMKMYKIMKFLSLFLIMAMILSVFACNSQNVSEESASGSSTDTSEPLTAETESAESSDKTEETSNNETVFDDSTETEHSTKDQSEMTSEEDTKETSDKEEECSTQETDSDGSTEAEDSQTEDQSETATEEKSEEASFDTEENDPTSEYRDRNSESGYIGRYIDYIMLDGEKILLTSDAMSVKLIDVTTSNKTLLFRGWAGFEGKLLKLGHALDNNAPIFDTEPMEAEQAVIDAAGKNAVRFTVSVDLSELSVGYHDFYLLAQVDLGGGITVKLLSFKIHKTEAIDSSDYLKPSDAEVVRYNVDHVKLDGELIKEGTDTKDLKAISSTSLSQSLTFFGWAGFKSNILSMGYAFDNEAPILKFTPSDTSEAPVLAAGGDLAKRFSVTADISKLSAGEHKMYLLALVDIDGGKIVKLMEFTLTVSEQCAHNSEENVWSAVAGEPKETATCANCGESITRNTSFILCYEKIIHGGGEKIGNVFTLDSAHVIDDISEAFVTDNGLYFQGWLGINSGTKEYKWSIDGKEWFDVDESSSYRDDSADVLSAIAKKSEENKLGLKNYASKIRFYITVSGISKLPAGNYDIYLGAIPNNNPDTVVPVIQIKNVTVAATPDADTALKTINGTAISEYKIVIEGDHYGVKRAQELLSKELYLASGIVLPVSNSGIAGTKTILIRSSDTYNNGNVGGGEYYFEINGDSIIIGGSGIYGPIAAAKAFAEAVNGKTDATVASNTSAILDLSNTKEKLSGNGALNIGFIGDSVTFGHGPVTPWPSFFSDSLKQIYSSANIKALNAAKSGSTSSWGNENINSLLLDKGYNDLVFLSHGTNDQYYIGGYAESYANYVSMIEKIYSSNPDADIVFVFCGRDYEMKGIYSISGGSVSPFMRAMIDVALEYDLAIIDPMTTLYEACAEYAPNSIMDNGWKYYMQDEVHPNVIGQELYGEIVYQYVSEALK